MHEYGRCSGPEGPDSGSKGQGLKLSPVVVLCSSAGLFTFTVPVSTMKNEYTGKLEKVLGTVCVRLASIHGEVAVSNTP